MSWPLSSALCVPEKTVIPPDDVHLNAMIHNLRSITQIYNAESNQPWNTNLWHRCKQRGVQVCCFLFYERPQPAKQTRAHDRGGVGGSLVLTLTCGASRCLLLPHHCRLWGGTKTTSPQVICYLLIADSQELLFVTLPRNIKGLRVLSLISH